MKKVRMVSNPRLSDIMREFVEGMTVPLYRSKIIEEILKRWSSQAKNPGNSIINELRYGGYEVFPIGNGYYAPQFWIVDGTRFRISLERRHIENGLIEATLLEPFISLKKLRENKDFSFIEEETNQNIPFEIVIGEGTFLEMPTQVFLFDFSKWLREKDAKRHDSLIFTVSDYRKGVYLLQYEPGKTTRKFLRQIEEQNRRLADAIYRVLEEVGERFPHRDDVLLRAYTSFETKKDYPGDNWRKVIEGDEKMEWDDLAIRKIENLRPIDRIAGITPKLKKLRERLEVEIEEFNKKYDELSDETRKNLREPGGEPNSIVKVEADFDTDEEEAYKALERHNRVLMDEFYDYLLKTEGIKEKTVGSIVGSVQLFSGYLTRYEATPLVYADFKNILDFIFEYYPRKVLSSSSDRAAEILKDLRRFYEFLETKGKIRSSEFSRAAYQFKELAQEKVRLYDRTGPFSDKKLFESLFHDIF